MIIKKIFNKYRQPITFMLFGLCTTMVDYGAYFIFGGIVGSENMLEEKYYMLGNLFSWFFAVTFAFVTNKMFVFRSKKWNVQTLIKEIPAFYGTRFVALMVSEIGIWLLVSVAGLKNFSVTVLSVVVQGDLIAKLIMSIVSTVLNYIFGKFIIFSKVSKENHGV